MKDEVLKPYSVDNYEDDEAIPRYDIILPSGETLYHGVQLRLCNDIIEQGTPLNKKNLLSDDTSRALGLDPATSTPDEAFKALRSAAGFCPKLIVPYMQRGVVFVRNETTLEVQQKTVSTEGFVMFDILEYGVYSIWGDYFSIRTDYPGLLTVDTTKIYQIDLEYFSRTLKVQVTEEVGATIYVRHSDGNNFVDTIGADKTLSMILPKTGNYTVWGVYNECTSLTIPLGVSESTSELTTVSLTWTTVIVRAETGSTVTVTSGTFTTGGTTVDGQIKIWLPGYATYTVTATLGDKSTTDTLKVTEYKNYNVTLRYL